MACPIGTPISEITAHAVRRFAFILAMPFALPLLAPPAQAQAAQAQAPQALCAGKGTLDETKPIPQSLVQAASRLFGAGDPSFIKTSTVYRCMNNEVWLCSYGANIVCDKADTNRNNPGVVQWCKDHPGSTDIPMAATGHGTIYSWKCVGTKPSIAGVVQKLDPRGYIAENWKRLR